MVKYRIQKIGIFFLFFLLCCSYICPIHAQRSSDDKDRVLFISSYSYAWVTVPQQIEGIKSVLGDSVTLDYKFMDTKNVSSLENLDIFYQEMKEFLKSVDSYDGIIVGDDAAFNFVQKYQKEFFNNVPIAFEGVNDVIKAKSFSEDKLISGVVETLAYDNTIRAAKKIYPKIKNVVAILDNSVTATIERRKFFSCRKKFKDINFQEIDVSKLSKEEIQNRIAKLDNHTMLLYVLFTEDGQGHHYQSYESVNLVTKAASIPVFSVVSNGIGEGLLGGELVSQKKMGILAAQMIKDSLNGKPMSEQEMITESPRTYLFDEQVMDQYSIKAEELPHGAELINHTAGFFEKNEQIFRVLIVGVVGILIVIVLLAYDNMKRRQMNLELEGMNDSLEYHANYDFTTKILNQRVFERITADIIEKQGVFTLLLVNINRFHEINEKHGYGIGDLVLQEIGARLIKLQGRDVQVFRYSGDEFIVLVHSIVSDDVEHYIGSIQKIFEKPFDIGSKELQVFVSIGAAIYPEDGNNSGELMAAAMAAIGYAREFVTDNVAWYQQARNHANQHRKDENK